MPPLPSTCHTTLQLLQKRSGNMPRHSTHDKVAAVKAYYWARGSLPVAALLLLFLTGGTFTGNPYSFIPYWVREFEARGFVQPKPPPGRRSRMDEELATECCGLIENGYATPQGEHRYFRSMRHALQMCPRLREIMGNTRLKQQQMLRRIKAACPELCRRTLRFVRLLGPGTKRQRADYAVRMLQMVAATPDGPDYTELRKFLARFMWIDSKVVYVVPRDCLVYAPPNADLYIQDDRLPRSRSQIRKINYYVVVNALLGPVHFKVVTGTTNITDIDPAYPVQGYQVRAGRAGQRAAPSYAYEFVRSRNQQWGFSFTAATACCTSGPHCWSSA